MSAQEVIFYNRASGTRTCQSEITADMRELDAGGEASGLATRRLTSLVMWTPRFEDLCVRNSLLGTEQFV